jgi:hypothetical protein
MGLYDHYINTKKVIPPVGKTLGWTAYVQFMFLKSGQENVRVEHDFGEALGRTKEEAYKEMKARVEEWIKTQESSCPPLQEY